jgi:Flp pilus assembly protein TadG
MAAPADRVRAEAERGQDTVEFALILPVLFLIIMGIFDMGRAVYTASVLHNAAREGARYGSIFPADTAGIETAARQLSVGLVAADVDVDITVTNTSPARTIVVAVQYDMPLVTPLIGAFFGGQTVPLGSQASMLVER